MSSLASKARVGAGGTTGRATIEVPSTLDWAKTYKALGLQAAYAVYVDATNPAVLMPKPGWVVPMLKGLSYDKWVAACRELRIRLRLPVGHLDLRIVANDRDPDNGSYLVRFSRSVEPDADLDALSADDLVKRGVKGITLLERLVLGLGYFLTTDGKRLDEDCVTLCSGSRDKRGRVPTVDFYDEPCLECVSFVGSDEAANYLGARAVSLG